MNKRTQQAIEKKRPWKSIGKKQVRQIVKYREFEELEIGDDFFDGPYTLKELKRQLECWIDMHGEDTEIKVSCSSYETIEVSLVRPVPGSNETEELL